MRIISKKRDYYDSVMKTGMDREVVYVRETKDVDLDRKYGLEDFYSPLSSHYSVCLNYLGYCGQIYRVYEAYIGSVSSGSYSRHTFYDFQEFSNFMLRNGLASEWDFSTRRWWPGIYQRFNELDTKPLLELFHQYQTPLFLISSDKRDGKKYKLTLGPNLKKLEFQRIKDTYTAYQDIFQYVAGTLNRREENMIKISDKDKIHKHGFDKWSFRKLPTKRKKK